jgi:serine protease AprX
VTTAALLGLAGFLWGTPPERRADDETRHVIVQAANLDGATAAVRAVGGEVTHQLGIINAVGAHLTLDEVRRVEAVDATVRVHADRQTTVAGKKKNRTASTSTTSTTSKTAGNVFSVPPTYIGQVIDASTLHEQGLRGAGVAVAVIDTGVWDHKSVRDDTNGDTRVVATYDAITNEASEREQDLDNYGHGTHVASIVMANTQDVFGRYVGVAPDANLVGVKAFDDNGQGTYADVIRALDWVVANKDAYGIRVLNLSFSAPPQSHYWDDPLNQAVMQAWQTGIVVVASAGNTGPNPMTIGVPGNLLLRRADRRGLRQAGTGGTGWTRPRHHEHVSRHRQPASRIQHQQAVLHDVRHVAIGGGGERRGSVDDPAGPVFDAR